MGLVRLKIRELADQKGWTLKDVADRANVPYSTVRHYARSQGLATVDITSIQKIARIFDVLIEDLMEVIED
ncbi:MAG TPA: transcriptional regulator [Cyanobacteria bacterium UBA11372]|nr:transcriptional regulator [Cyanobacteria bacterium UBA11372]HBE33034.1 transcriptional regulator [Cyanobacteria bacterium UBA11368]HBE49865.1 transcriptional regulator [Cyanobacteria bacterium UBA11369]